MIKVKDGYGKLIGSEYKGSADLVLLSDGSNLGYAIPSTGNTLVLRNTSGQIESSLTTDSNLSPFVVTSTVVNTNLNSDLLDGFHAGGLFLTLSSSTSVNLTVKIGNTEKKIEKLYATYDGLGNTIAAKYVTLDTALTISGVKTFSSLLKFTVSSVSPFTVNSNVVVTNLNADLLDGTHKADLFTDFSNITSGTDINKVSITIGGTTKKIIINYAQNAGSIGGITADNLFTDLSSTPAKNLSITIGGTTKDITSLYSNYWVPQAIGSKDFNTMYGDTYRGTSWYGGGSNTATNNPLGSGSAFGMLVWRNADGYTALLIMSSNGKLYIRYYNGSTWSELKQFAFTTDAGLGGGYWADLAVLATADSGTKPTFAEATVTTQVTTPRVRSTGRLTLNAASTALDLKFANDNTKSVILNGTEFKPFDSANGNLDLGASDARWKGLFAGTGDFTGIVRTTGEGFYLASTSTYSRSRWFYTSDGIWLLAANWDGNSVKGTLWITGHYANNLTALKIKADNTDYNGTLSITSDGRIAATNTGSRQAGMYGIYDSTKVGHIWSMGTSFAINANGSNTGNLYGLAYFHTNWSNAPAKNDGSKTEVSPYAGNHQAAWLVNGKVCASLGNYVWSRNGFIKHGSDDTYALTGGGGHKAIGNVQNTAFYKRETSVNGTVWNMAGTTNSAAFTIYAPTTAGTSGYLLKSNGSGAPTWVAPSSISIGNADTLDGRHACKSFASASAIDFTAIFWIASGAISDVSTMSWASLINVGNGSTRRWQIWNSRNDHLLYWRPEKADYSDYADVHILLDNYNFKNYVDDMYWANVKVSATSSTTTTPTFALTTATAYIATQNGQILLWGPSKEYWLGSNTTSDFYLWGSSSTAHLRLGTNNTERVRVTKDGNVGIGTTSPSYKLHVAGDAYATGWSRANNGFYVEGTGVHYTHQGSVGEINMINNNEFLWSTSNGSLFFNYRAVSRGRTVTNYIWNAGSSGSYASHTLGALTSRGDLALYGLTQTCNKANNADYMNSALLIREYNFGGSQTDSWAIAPRLSWHWSGRVQTQIGLNSSGDLKLSRDNFATSYLLLHLGNSSVGDYSVTIGNTAKNFVRDWGYGAANMNAIARGGRSSMGMANLNTPSGGTASYVNPNGLTDWHHFINIAYTDGGAGSNSWITQIANKAGTTDLWVRSRSGGTISNTANWTAGWTRILTGTNYASVLDGRYYTESEADNRFVNVTGDTMTGPLTFANGTWNVVGDDAAIGDYNAAGMLGLKSINNNIPGIGFHNSSNTLLGRLQASGSNLLWNGNKIWHAGNDGSGSGLDADMLDGKHLSSFITYELTTGYVGASFNSKDLSKKAASTYIEYWDGAGGWFNSRWGLVLAISGFHRVGSSDSYVLLGGGGHKALSDFAMASAYVKKAGDTMTGRLTMTGEGIIVTTATTSNYRAGVEFYKGTAADTTYSYDAQIGWHNTGGGGTGAICILPYATSTLPWGGSVGLYITKTELKYNNQAILHSGNSSVSGGGSAGGSSITVKINNTSKTLTIPTSLPANGGTSSNVVVNDSNANSTYRMVWHSGNTLYSTNNIYCNPSTDQIYSAGFRHVSYNSASYLLRSDGGAAAFNWSGQSGQPNWLWGGNSQHTYYVYNPSNFNVNSAAKLRVVSCYNGTTNNDLWSTIKSSNSSYLGTSTMYEVYNDGGPTTYGHVLDTVTVHSNHWQSQLWMAAGKGGRLYYRNKDYNNNTWGDWRTVAWTSDIPSVGNGTIIINQGGSEKGRFTVNQSGTTTINLTDSNTNTWRGVENVLTSTSTSNSLTANMGRVLANGASDRPIVLLAGTLYRRGASSSYTTWYFNGYRHRSISSSSPSVYVSGGVARFYFTNASGYGFSFAQVCANHQASGEATGYQSGEYQTRNSGLFWFGTYASGLYLYIRAIALGNEHNDTAESYTGMWTNYSDGVTRVSIIAVGYAW